MFIILGGDGKEYGPVSVEQIRTWITAGRANLDTKAKALGTEEWRRLADFAEFSSPDGAPPVMAVMAARAAADANLADRGVRFAAALIDGLLSRLCMLPTSLAVSQVFSQEIASGHPSIPAIMATMSGAMTKSLPFLAALAIVQAILLTKRGQSVGKLATGLRIVRHSDGAPAGFVRAFFLRGTVPWLIELVPILGSFFFWIVDVCFIFTDERRCLHDLIAGTKVVKA